MSASEAPASREVAFGALTIRYDDRVLEPRPWTVRQADWAAELLPDLPAGDVLELCCGVGQIGLLAVTGSDRALVLVDVSPDACAHARANAARAFADGLGPSGGVEVRQGALEDALGSTEHFALVLADPPYVPTDRVTDHPEDPPTAIDGGGDGLDVIRVCLELVDRHLLPEGAALVQLGDEAQVDTVAAYLSDAGHDLRMAASEVQEAGALALLRRRRPPA